MIGSGIQSLVLVQRQLPRAAALTVLLMLLLGISVLLGRRAGARDDLLVP
jgi:ABC-type spermidine/putrescine transport system permease subunit I